jgi:hypothetical protein
MHRLFLATVLFLTLQAGAFAQVSVDGYTRRDGTYVQPHHRSNPDNSYNNNWNVSPNTNPYTGQTGERQPTYNDRAPAPTYNYGTTYGNRRY